jgi:hypothetical protein
MGWPYLQVTQPWRDLEPPRLVRFGFDNSIRHSTQFAKTMTYPTHERLRGIVAENRRRSKRPLFSRRGDCPVFLARVTLELSANWTLRLDFPDCQGPDIAAWRTQSTTVGISLVAGDWGDIRSTVPLLTTPSLTDHPFMRRAVPTRELSAHAFI